MNSRKEMVPAPVRKEHGSPMFCLPEWNLLCRIRQQIGDITAKHTKSKILVILTNVIHDMNETFTDWPEIELPKLEAAIQSADELLEGMKHEKSSD